MLTPLLSLAPLLFLSAAAQSGSISTTPLLTCSLTTFSCPGISNGCCTIGGCCGGACCANGYTCINEGTATQACCDVYDETKCGTVSGDSGTGDGTTGQGGSGKTCTGIQNCARDPVRGLAWTCLLGKTCGFSYNECNACPYIGNIGGDDDSSSGSGSSSSSYIAPASTTTPAVLPTSSSSSASGSTPSFAGSSPSSGGGTTPSSARREDGGGVKLLWLVAACFAGVFGIGYLGF